MNKYISIIFVLLLLACANKTSDRDVDEFLTFFPEPLSRKTDSVYIIVIPSSGCMGCIDKVFDFAHADDNRNFFFLLTGNTRKEIELVSQGRTKNMFGIDSLGFWSSTVGFPVLYIVSDYRILKKVELNGNNIDSVIFFGKDR